jgi:hypothetical protein
MNTMRAHTRLPAPLACRCAVAWLLAMTCGATHSATLLEYRHEGACSTDFERMAISGLHARIDMGFEDGAMSTLFDDGEQLMHQLMHDTHTYMTMESDDDAVDFNSDVARSTSLFAEHQTRAVTGMDNQQALARFRSAQVAACPEMASLGFGDPDYAEAATRCVEKMATATMPAAGDRKDIIAQRLRQGRQAPAAPTTGGADTAPATWSTTTIERDAVPGSVDGRACTTERIRRGATILREDCLADVNSLALEPRAVRRLQRIAKVGEGLGAGVASLHPEIQEHRPGPPTISLRRVCYRDGAVSGNAVLQIRADVQIDPALFELPAGYAPLQITPPSATSPAEALEALELLRAGEDD